MGVRGLQTYMEKCCPQCSPTVSIQDIVSEHRKSTNQKVVIVVDGSSCIRRLYGDLEWIGGGQLKQFAEKAQHFVEAFAEIGVQLVFFFDGPTVEKKRKTWVERRMNKLESTYTVLDEISRGKPTDSIAKRHFQLPPGLGQLSRVIFENISECEVYQSLNECDEEIAEYARENKAFAILSQDSDFVILQTGNALYLSMDHLNLYNMTTRMYDRWMLARSLRIHHAQLPLLATLMGNDVVKAQDLKEFHMKITGQNDSNRNINFRALVPRIADYIRQLPLNKKVLYNMLPDMARRCLGHPSRHHDIYVSLCSYDSSPNGDGRRKEVDRHDKWSRLVAKARELHQINEFPSMVYAIMSGLPFESSTSIEDFRKEDIPSFAVATQPIRQRIYGILLQEKPLSGSGSHLVPEWCMAGPGSLDEAKFVPAVLPKPAHPGLLKLWSIDRQLLSVRWHLFVSSVSSKLDVSRVKNTLRPYLVVPTLILFYINELRCLKPWELDAMLATATCLKHYDTAQLEKLPSDPISSRGIRVANLIMRSTFILYILLAACGSPLTTEETAPMHFFDGKLFQIKYNQAESKYSHIQLCDNKVSVLEEFQLARHIVFDN